MATPLYTHRESMQYLTRLKKFKPRGLTRKKTHTLKKKKCQLLQSNCTKEIVLQRILNLHTFNNITQNWKNSTSTITMTTFKKEEKKKKKNQRKRGSSRNGRDPSSYIKFMSEEHWFMVKLLVPYCITLGDRSFLS